MSQENKMTKRELSDYLKALAQEKLGVPVEKMNFLGAGSFGRVFSAELADSSVAVLKAFYYSDGLEDEAYRLKLLAEHTHVAMPHVLFTHSGDAVDVLCMTLIEGRNVLDPRFLLKGAEQKRAFAADVVRGMSEWHKVRGTAYGNLQNPAYSSWNELYLETIVEPTIEGISELVRRGKFNKKEYDLLCRARDRYAVLADEPEYPALIHGDLNIMNIMADPKTLKLTGFIDPGSSMWADREYDLYQLQNMWGNSYGIYEAYKAGHKLSPNSDFKMAFYGAVNEDATFLKPGMHFYIWRALWRRRLEGLME